MADAPPLGVKDFRGAVRKPDGKFQGECRIVRLAERHARPGRLALPDIVQRLRDCRTPLEPRQGPEGR